MAVDAAAMALFDRFLFAFTIASHIIIVSISIALIVMISVAEFISIRRNDGYYSALSTRLSRVFVISFGVGTASGIVMAVELVTLFPGFMTLVSQTGVIALFYAEVFAFFLETIALVLYVYYAGYFRGKYSHWVLSLFVMGGTLTSAVFITMVNAWMNTPNGFDFASFIQSGKVSAVDPWAPFNTASTFGEIAHVLPTMLFTGAMLTGGYFAWRYLKTRDAEEKKMISKGLKIAAAIGVLMIILSGLGGSNEMVTLLQFQPLKYAAVDLNPVPGTNLPERLFGTLVNGQVSGGILIPSMQTFLAQFESGITTLPGLSQFPSSNWPPLYIHTTFDIMIVGGMLLGLYFLAFLLSGLLLKKKPQESKIFLYLWIPLAFLALIVMELGWITDEVGRQPWIVYNVMTVQSAANTGSGLLIPGIIIISFYIIVIPLTFYFFTRIFTSGPPREEMKSEQAIMEGSVNY